MKIYSKLSIKYTKKIIFIFLFAAVYLVFGKNSLAATSVPVPQPVDTPGYLVGAFYMPKDPTLNMEWLQLYKWNGEGGRGVTRWPYLGLASGANLEAMNWQIKWAVEHGVKLFVFDWYTSPQFQATLIKPTWEDSLNSFMAADYSSSMNFSLYFTAVSLIKNSTGSLDTDKSRQELEKIADYWCDHYFNKQNYLKVNNQPVVFLNYEGQLGMFGQTNVLSTIKNRAKLKGFTGIYFVAVRGAWIEGSVDWFKGVVGGMRDNGFNAFSAYGYDFCRSDPTYCPGFIADCANYPSAFADFTSQMLSVDPTRIKFIPAINAFSNLTIDKGTDYPSCNNPSVSLFRQTLQNTKDKIGVKPDGAVDVSGKRLVMITSWNEWREGSNIEPGVRLGYENDKFSFLKAVRNVFSSTASWNSQTPTESLGPLSPGPYDMRLEESSGQLLFNTQAELDKWHIQNGSSSLILIDNKYGRSYVNPFFENNYGVLKAWRGLLLPSNINKLKISFRSRCGYNFDTNCHIKDLVFYWTTDLNTQIPNFSSYYSRYIIGNTDTEIAEDSQYTTDLSNNANWKGNIQQIWIRLNIINAPARIDFSEVTLSSANPADVNGDGKIDINDLLLILRNWGKSGQGDVNGDGKVNGFDFSFILKSL